MQIAGRTPTGASFREGIADEVVTFGRATDSSMRGRYRTIHGVIEILELTCISDGVPSLVDEIKVEIVVGTILDARWSRYRKCMVFVSPTKIRHALPTIGGCVLTEERPLSGDIWPILDIYSHCLPEGIV